MMADEVLGCCKIELLHGSGFWNQLFENGVVLDPVFLRQDNLDTRNCLSQASVNERSAKKSFYDVCEYFTGNGPFRIL